MTSTALDILQRVNQKWHPSQLAIAARNDTKSSAELAELVTLKDAYKLFLLSETLNKQSEESLALFIRTHQNFIIRMANTFDEYARFAFTVAQKKWGIQTFYADAFLHFEELIDLLERHFPHWLRDSVMPNLYCRHWLQAHPEMLNDLQKCLTKFTTDREIISLLLQPFNDLLDKDQKRECTYFQWRYLKNISQEIGRLKFFHREEGSFMNILNLIVFTNYNEPNLLVCLHRKITAELQNITDHDERKQTAVDWLRKLHQLPAKLNTGYMSDLTSVKDAVSSWLINELEALDISNSVMVQQPSSTQVSNVKWELGISVAALAVIIRAAFDTAFIRNADHRIIGFLRSLSLVIRTPQSAEISPLSLKNRLYTIESGAQEIAKDWLMRMYKQIHKY